MEAVMYPKMNETKSLTESFNLLCNQAIKDRKMKKNMWGIVAVTVPPVGSSSRYPGVMSHLYGNMEKKEAEEKCKHLVSISCNSSIIIRVVPEVGMYFSLPGKEGLEVAIDKNKNVKEVVRLETPKDNLEKMQAASDSIREWVDEHGTSKEDEESLAYFAQSYWNLFRQTSMIEQQTKKLNETKESVSKSVDVLQTSKFLKSDLENYMIDSLEKMQQVDVIGYFKKWSASNKYTVGKEEAKE